MQRVVLAGQSTPLQKVLEGVAEASLPGLAVPAVFTDPEPGVRMAELIRSLGAEVRPLDRLAGEAGAAALAAHEPDWFFNVSSTLLFAESLLAVPRRGALNMHPGRLPDYAGLHTHQWAIRNGESSFAATLHWMTGRVDAGPVAAVREFPLSERDTGLSVYLKCCNAGAVLVLEALLGIAAGREPAREPQDMSRRRVYTGAMAKDGRVPWHLPARAVADFVRAVDYGPFACPTYTPEARVGDRTFLVRKAVVAGPDQAEVPAGARPGLVLRSGEGAAVACGDSSAVLLTLVELSGQGRFAGADAGTALAALGAAPGAVLAVPSARDQEEA